MRTCNWVILLYFLILNVSLASAQQDEEKKVITAFENRVAVFEKFFAAQPKFIEDQSYNTSPSGHIFFWNRFDNCQVSYDVKKTESLVSPYMGYISVSCDEVSTNKCGDFVQKFSTLELARQNKDNTACYGTDLTRETKYVFALQKGKWIFKDILNTYTNQTDRRFATLIGYNGPDRFPVADNDVWKILLKN